MREFCMSGSVGGWGAQAPWSTRPPSRFLAGGSSARRHVTSPVLGTGHPTEQIFPVLNWRPSCASCHDSASATAHMDVNTSSSGSESCEVCHGSRDALAVDVVHRSH